MQGLTSESTESSPLPEAKSIPAGRGPYPPQRRRRQCTPTIRCRTASGHFQHPAEGTNETTAVITHEQARENGTARTMTPAVTDEMVAVVFGSWSSLQNMVTEIRRTAACQRGIPASVNRARTRNKGSTGMNTAQVVFRLASCCNAGHAQNRRQVMIGRTSDHDDGRRESWQRLPSVAKFCPRVAMHEAAWPLMSSAT